METQSSGRPGDDFSFAIPHRFFKNFSRVSSISILKGFLFYLTFDSRLQPTGHAENHFLNDTQVLDSRGFGGQHSVPRPSVVSTTSSYHLERESYRPKALL